MKPSPLPNPVKALGLGEEDADIDELLIRNDRAEGFPRAGEAESAFDLEDMSALPLEAKVASSAVSVDRSELERSHRRAGIRRDP